MQSFSNLLLFKFHPLTFLFRLFYRLFGRKFRCFLCLLIILKDFFFFGYFESCLEGFGIWTWEIVFVATKLNNHCTINGYIISIRDTVVAREPPSLFSMPLCSFHRASDYFHLIFMRTNISVDHPQFHFNKYRSLYFMLFDL